MGSCCQQQQYDGSDNDKCFKTQYKIILLGSAACGKSTIFKQIRKLYGEGFTNKDRKDAKFGVAVFVIDTMQILLDDERCVIQQFEQNIKDAARNIQSIQTNSTTSLTKDLINNIKVLWNEEIIKNIFNETAKLYSIQTCAHYFDNIDRIPSNITDKDILLQRRPTTGLIEQYILKSSIIDRKIIIMVIESWIRILIINYIPNDIIYLIAQFCQKYQDDKDIKFLLVDVGGTKNERRKWIHHLENLSAVIYVISLSAFNERLYEDDTINSLHDAIQLFRDTINDDYMQHVPFFVIFNKKDIFEQKIMNKSLLECFNDESEYDKYDENKYFNECKNEQDKVIKNIEFIKNVFLKQIDTDKYVETFVISALNDNEIINVLDQTFSTIIQ